MNQLSIKYASILVALMMSCSVHINAQEKHKHAMHHSEEVNQMHHQLEKDQAPFKAKEALALKDLNEMTIREDVKIEAVNAKIDDLMAAKKQIMRLRYDHLIQMRKTLTDEEKVKYDKRVLHRSEVK
jgi:hypothetical protein